jgi:DNA-binding transcriptional LysR family regulator
VAGPVVTVDGAVKLHQVRCVVTAARCGSFRRAAADLNLQQSSVSRSVRDLEVRLGAPLFQRSACGVALTDVGAQFLEEAEVALDHLGRAAQIAEAVGRDERHVLRLGVVPIPGSGLLLDALHAITTTGPRCRIILHEASSAENLLALRAGELDLALVHGPSRANPSAEVTPLWREPLLCATPPGDDLNGVSPLSWRCVGPDGLILPSGEFGDRIAAKLSAIFGGAFSGAACRAGAETALQLTAVGQGRAIIPAGSARLAPAGLRLRRIADEGLLVNAVQLTRNEKPALRRLMNLLRQKATFRNAVEVAQAVEAGNPEPATF